MARPERIRFSLVDNAAGGTALVLPQRHMWLPAGILGATFATFAAIELIVITQMTGRPVDDVFDLSFMLFKGFWVLGWSVGVAFLGALTLLFLFYRESARLQNGKLVHVPRLGPLHIILEYDLAKMRNLRLEKAGAEDHVRVRFDYGEGQSGLGDGMRRADAESLIHIIQNAAAAAALTARPLEAPRRDPVPRAPHTLVPPAPPSIDSPSSLALIAANLLPLAGVLFFDWDLTGVILLFWAESGVIAFYTALKMAMVGKLAALFEVPFFIGHFGGFMAGHFMLIYTFFVLGPGSPRPEAGVQEALLRLFDPLWMPLAGFVMSHGVSFVTNFLGRREYATATVRALMTAPYKRIVVMHLTLIFGGWLIMLLKSPVSALAVLVVLKTILDLSAHRKEHADQPVAGSL